MARRRKIFQKLAGSAAASIIGPPALVGAPTVGIPVAFTHADAAGTAPLIGTQQWQLDGVDISGETALTYTPVSGDIGHDLSVVETIDNGYGPPVSSASDAITVIAAEIPFPIGFNVQPSSYYTGAGMYANRMYEATVLGSQSNVNANGYPKAATGCQYKIIGENAYQWWRYKPGTYVIKGTGNGATLTIYGAGFPTDVYTTSNGVAFRRTVTLPAMSAPSGNTAIRNVALTHLGLNVSNAGVAAINDLIVCHVDDEAHIAAGGPAALFTPECIADYQTTSRGPLRMMNWQQMVNAWCQDAADIPADGAVAILNAYAANSDGSKGSKTLRGVPPPEHMGRLCVATSMPMWVNVNPQMTDACMASFFARLLAEYPSGLLYVEISNEIWNGAYFKVNTNYLGTRYGTAGQPGAGAGLLTTGTGTAIQQAAAHASLRAWKQAELVFGSRVRRVINCQLVQPALSMQCMDYVDPGIITAGQKVGQLMHSAATATYPLVCGDVTANGLDTGRGVTQPPRYGIGIPPRWAIRHKAWIDDAAVNGGNAALWIEKAWRNAVDMITAYIGTYQSQLAAKSYPLMTLEYEGHWNHDDTPLYRAASHDVNGAQAVNGLCMTYIAATGEMVPASATVNGDAYTDAGESLSNWFADGDIIEPTFAGSTGISDRITYKCKIISGKLYAFLNTTTYTAGLGSQVTGGSDKTILLCNVTRMDAWQTFTVEQMWSNPDAIDGQTFIDYMHDSYRAAGLRVGCSFSIIGGAYLAFYTASGGFGAQGWAMKPDGHWQDNTAAFNRIKALS